MLHVMVLLDLAVLTSLSASLLFPANPAIAPHSLPVFALFGIDEPSPLPLLPLLSSALGVVYLLFLFWATRPNPNAEIKIIAFFLGFVPLTLGIAALRLTLLALSIPAPFHLTVFLNTAFTILVGAIGIAALDYWKEKGWKGDPTQFLTGNLDNFLKVQISKA